MNANMEFNNIFNSIMDADIKRQRNIKIKQIQLQIEDIKSKCGSCYHWMTSNCKREKNHKVSCNELKCYDFKLKIGYNKLLSELTIKMENLRTEK